MVVFTVHRVVCLLAVYIFAGVIPRSCYGADIVSSSTDPTTSTTSQLAWQGAWHFEPSWFAQQHPWLPKFVAKKALSSTLLLDDDGYHQLDHEGKPLKAKRPLRLVDTSPHKAQLVRTEGRKKEVAFHLERRKLKQL